jgi:hypothetical protein
MAGTVVVSRLAEVVVATLPDRPAGVGRRFFFLAMDRMPLAPR